MNKNGYFGIGCINMENAINYATLFRTAQIMEADYLFLIGKKFKKQASDTMNSWRHMPVFNYENFEEFYKNMPYDCRLIGIEMTENAIPIKEFKHPKTACYLLGSEKNGLTKQSIQKCDEIICLPGERSMNVAVAGSITIFDRIQKLKK